MKRIPYILGLLLALALLVSIRLPFLRCEAFVPGARLLYDEKDYLHGARSFAAGDTTSDTAEAWIRAPATSWVLLMVAGLYLLDVYARRVRLFGYRTIKVQ